MSESAKLRADHTRLEDELRTKRGLGQLDGLSDDAKLLLAADIAKMTKQSEEKKQELNATVCKLMETNYWPVLHPPDMKDAEEKYLTLKNVVTDLKDVVTK